MNIDKTLREKVIDTEIVNFNPGLDEPTELSYLKGNQLKKAAELQFIFPNEYKIMTTPLEEILRKLMSDTYALAVHHTLFPDEPMPDGEEYKLLKQAIEDLIASEIKGNELEY